MSFFLNFNFARMFIFFPKKKQKKECKLARAARKKRPSKKKIVLDKNCPSVCSQKSCHSQSSHLEISLVHSRSASDGGCLLCSVTVCGGRCTAGDGKRIPASARILPIRGPVHLGPSVANGGCKRKPIGNSDGFASRWFSTNRKRRVCAA